jgi:prevent-host-death family protein
MKLAEDIKSLTYVKDHPAEVIREININRRPIVITQKGAARAVLIDIDSYEKQKNTLFMLKLVAQGEKDIKYGDFIEQEEFFELMDQRFQQ